MVVGETIITKLRDLANDVGVKFLAKKHVLEIEHYEDKQKYIVLMMRF